MKYVQGNIESCHHNEKERIHQLILKMQQDMRQQQNATSAAIIKTMRYSTSFRDAKLSRN